MNTSPTGQHQATEPGPRKRHGRWPNGALRRLRGVGRKNRVLAGIVAISALAAGTLMATAPHPEPTAVEEKAWPVTTVSAQAGTLAPELQLFGLVESPHHARLSSAIAAEVLRVHVQEGQRVHEGALLISLDAEEERLKMQRAEADLREAEAQLATVQRDLETNRQVLAHMQQLYDLTSAKAERLKNLAGRQLIATEQMENTLQEVARQGIELARQRALVDKHPQRLATAEAALERARAAAENQRLNLARTEIRAPFPGRVSHLLASPGDRVATGSELLSIYDTGALQVRAALPPASLAALKQALDSGRPVTARIEGNAAPLPLSELAAAVEQGRSGVDGLFALPDGGAGLELGRAVELRLDLPPVEDVVALPLQSLYNNSRIYVVEEGRLRGIPVSLRGQRTNADGELEILVDAGPLPVRAEVLATSLPKAASGLLVEAIATAIASSDAKSQAKDDAAIPSPSGTAKATRPG